MKKTATDSLIIRKSSIFTYIINFGTVLILFFLSLGQLGRLSFLGQQVNFYLYEIILVFNIIFLIAEYKLHPLKQIFEKYKAAFFFFIYLFVIFMVTAMGYSFESNVVGSLYLLRFFLYTIYFFFISYHFQLQPWFKEKFRIGIWVFIALSISAAILQYFLYPNFRNISYLGWDPHLYRMVGTFFDPPVAGAFFGLFFIFGFFYTQKWSIFLRFLTLLAPIGCILLTYSRGTYLGFVPIILLLIFKKKRIYGILVLTTISILAYAFLPKPQGESVNLLRTFSIFSRLNNYQEAVQLWQKQPLVGVGYNRIRYARKAADFTSQKDLENNHAGASFHSSFLVILVTGGGIGLGLFFWMLYSLAKKSYLGAVSIVYVSILSLTDNVMLHPFVLFFMYLLISL